MSDIEEHSNQLSALLDTLPIPEKYLIKSKDGSKQDSGGDSSDGSPTEGTWVDSAGRKVNCPFERERKLMFGNTALGNASCAIDHMGHLPASAIRHISCPYTFGDLCAVFLFLYPDHCLLLMMYFCFSIMHVCQLSHSAACCCFRFP